MPPGRRLDVKMTSKHVLVLPKVTNWTDLQQDWTAFGASEVAFTVSARGTGLPLCKLLIVLGVEGGDDALRHNDCGGSVLSVG